ncbi:MAG: hypothetical protein ACKVQW_01035 [Pyrinomonadaceae bacterium]
MTAEIVVMNKFGIALAADSAVTFSLPFIQRASAKIYTTNKLFTLSRHEPVGIMIYGAASLMTIPWEIIIKEYRKKTLRDRRFSTLEEYGKNFVDHINGNKFYFPSDLQIMAVFKIADQAGARIFNAFQAEMFKILSVTDQAVDADEISRLLSTLFAKTVDEELAELEALPNITTFRLAEKAFYKRYAQALNFAVKRLKENFTDSKLVSRSLITKFKRIAFLAVTKNTFIREQEKQPDSSGVVIAGYGEREIYPTLVAYDIEAVVNDKLKFIPIRRETVSNRNSAVIEPFAQSEMVHTFRDGISPNHKSYIDGLLRKILDTYPDKIAVALEGKLSDAQIKVLTKHFKDTGKDLLTDFEKERDEWIARRNTNPMNATVSTLPVDELASMAASMVNLTSSKRRVTPVLETVGGPVDVAVITKGDGFVWIDRKHYFDADKNPHFFANNYKERKDEKRQRKTRAT